MAKRKRCADAHEEGTEEYESIHVDPVALNEVFEIIKRLRRANGSIGSQYEWYAGVCPSYNTRLSYNPSQILVDESLREKAVETRNVLKPAVDALYKIWGHVSYLLEACEGNIEAYDNRRGFFRLPDEILSAVLEYAALQDAQHGCKYLREDDDYDGEKMEKTFVLKTVKSAVKLSHVCKRFRELVVSSPCLWNRVFRGMGNKEMVSTCLERCRTGNVEVRTSSSLFVSQWFSYSTSLGNNSFLDMVLTKTELWGSFIFTSDAEGYRESDSNPGKDYAKLAEDRDFSNLKHLSISYPQDVLKSRVCNDLKLQKAMHFYSKWTTPWLQSIYTRNFIPVAFSGTHSLTSAHVELVFDSARITGNSDNKSLDVNALVSFLSACPALRKLKLDLRDAERHYVSSSESSPPALTSAPNKALLVMPAVTDLDLSFYDCRSAPLKCLFSAVSFPSVSKMQLDIRSDLEDANDYDRHFHFVFHAIIPSADAFPNLLELELVASCWGFWYDCDEDGKEVGKVRNQGVIDIPFAVLPQTLRRLTLKTFSSEVGMVLAGMALPALRELSLVDCSKMKREWLVGFLRQMEGQGQLESLSVSVDEGCGCMVEDGVCGVLSKEDMRKLITDDTGMDN